MSSGTSLMLSMVHGTNMPLTTLWCVWMEGKKEGRGGEGSRVEFVKNKLILY